MFPHRFGPRQPHLFQLQPLQGPLPSASEVPQVPAACQRREQGKESPGGPAAAGTRGRVEGIISHSREVFKSSSSPCSSLSHQTFLQSAFLHFTSPKHDKHITNFMKVASLLCGWTKNKHDGAFSTTHRSMTSSGDSHNSCLDEAVLLKSCV